MPSLGNQIKKGLEKSFVDAKVPMNLNTTDSMRKYVSGLKEDEKLKGGLADKKNLRDIAKKHNVDEIEISKEFLKGLNVEMEHTSDSVTATEIVLDHLYEKPNYYTSNMMEETKESLIVKPVSKKIAQKFIGKPGVQHKPISRLFYGGKTESKESIEKDGEKISAKKAFAADLQKDPDFQDFKTRAKFDYKGTTDSFGTPNVSVSDPYIKKKTKYGRPGRGKEETKEATSTMAVGQYNTGAIFGTPDDDFIKRSFGETPKLKEEFTGGETDEATTSVGGYSTPAMWAKSTKKKDWGPSRKTQLKGGSFVKVKKKCTKFPYCNQGDINALTITEREKVQTAIKNVAKKMKINPKIIENIVIEEISKIYKRLK